MGASTLAEKSETVRAERLAELGLAFKRVFRTLGRMRGRDTHLAEGELSHAQLELLVELEQRGELAAGELAAAARLSPATVTQMLDHLAACGHVERVRSEHDRRIVVSRLTRTGARKLRARRAAWEERWREALEGVGERDLATTTRVLERLAEMFERADAGACEQAGQRPASEPAGGS